MSNAALGSGVVVQIPTCAKDSVQVTKSVSNVIFLVI